MDAVSKEGQPTVAGFQSCGSKLIFWANDEHLLLHNMLWGKKQHLFLRSYPSVRADAGGHIEESSAMITAVLSGEMMQKKKQQFGGGV